MAGRNISEETPPGGRPWRFGALAQQRRVVAELNGGIGSRAPVRGRKKLALGKLTLRATAGIGRAVVASSNAEWPFRPISRFSGYRSALAPATKASQGRCDCREQRRADQDPHHG